MLTNPALADPEVAEETFKQHLSSLWDTGRPKQRGWELIHLDGLHSIVKMPGIRRNGNVDSYFIKLGAEYYDLFPPTAMFVEPCNWSEAKDNTEWFPSINPRPPWFGLHANYNIQGNPRQLVCFSFTFEYYLTHGVPQDSQHWKKGKHTVAATLNRLSEVLSPQYYQGPSCL